MVGNLYIITSPSGGGKGTLIREVLRTTADVGYSVSFTTRPKRVGEEHGRDYFFVSRDEFDKLIAEDAFLEYANVHGNFYGTSRVQVESEIRRGRDIILEIDVQGAEAVKKLMPDAVSIFILPPSYEVLEQRLKARETETEEDLKIRLDNAKTEVESCAKFDYFVVNDEVFKASQNLQAIFLAERLKCSRQNDNIEKIIETFRRK